MSDLILTMNRPTKSVRMRIVRICVPEELYDRITEERARSGNSLGAVIRDILGEHYYGGDQ